MDKSREQFEKWFSKSYSCITKLFRLNSEGEYENLTIRASWRAWQASRSAIEIDLPRVIDAHPLGPQSAKMICAFHKNVVGECAEAIRTAGIKVKE